MAPENTVTGVQLGLYVRSLVPRHGGSRQATVLDRLEALARAGDIDDYGVTVSGRQVPPTPEDARTEVGSALASDVRTFREWARRNGLSLAETFTDRTVESAVTEERYRAINCPRMALAEYHGRDLAFVAPVTDGSRTYTIEERLDALAEGETATPFLPIERARRDDQKVVPTP